MLSYHVWRVTDDGPTFLGSIEAADYIDAVHRARAQFGGHVEVYLPPSRSAGFVTRRAAVTVA